MRRKAGISAADGYRKQFWAGAVKHLPHHAVVKVAKATKNDALVRYAYRNRKEELGKSQLKPYAQTDIDAELVGAQLTFGTDNS